jgi:hypothetical protein
MSRREDDEIAATLAAEAKARHAADLAAAAQRMRAEARKAAQRPRVSVPVEHLDGLRTLTSDAETLLRQIQADYLKLSAGHRQRLGDLRRDLAALVARIDADQQTITRATKPRAKPRSRR